MPFKIAQVANRQYLFYSGIRAFRGVRPYLVALHPVEQRDADDRSPDPGVVAQRGKHERLHLHVDDALGVDLLQEVEFVLLGVVTEGSVQPTLACRVMGRDVL